MWESLLSVSPIHYVMVLMNRVTSSLSSCLLCISKISGKLSYLNCCIYLQSLDYDICENHLLLEEERTKGYKFIVKKNFARWFIFLLIGMLTALIACVIDITIEELSHIKYKSLKNCILYTTTICIRG